MRCRRSSVTCTRDKQEEGNTCARNSRRVFLLLTAAWSLVTARRSFRKCRRAVRDRQIFDSIVLEHLHADNTANSMFTVPGTNYDRWKLTPCMIEIHIQRHNRLCSLHHTDPDKYSQTRCHNRLSKPFSHPRNTIDTPPCLVLAARPVAPKHSGEKGRHTDTCLKRAPSLPNGHDDNVLHCSLR